MISDIFLNLLTHWVWPGQWLNHEISSLSKPKKQILTTAITIIRFRYIAGCAFASLGHCITCSTTATSAIRTYKCCWRRRKTISSKSNLYRNMEGIASICFQPQLCWILQTTDLWVSKDSESCGKSINTHL